MDSILFELLVEKICGDGMDIWGIFILLFCIYLPANKLIYSFKVANDLGIETPIRKVVNILTEYVAWFIIIGLEGILLAELLMKNISDLELFTDVISIIWLFAILLLFGCVQCEMVGRKIRQNILAIILILNFLIIIVIATSFNWWIYRETTVTDKNVMYFSVIVVLSAFFEVLFRYSLSNRKKKHTFYYAKGYKYYLHKITAKEVVCSYNRRLDYRKGYTVERIDNVKQNVLYQEYEDTAYSYFKDVLLQNKVKVFEYKEMIDADLAEIENQLGIPQLSTSSEIPQFYWGVVFMVKAKKRKLIEEKMRKIDMKYYKNNGWLWIDTENKKRHILLLYCQKNRPTRKIFTNKLDVFLEHVASYFEYSPREECV